jgi:hypothetical protein
MRYGSMPWSSDRHVSQNTPTRHSPVATDRLLTLPYENINAFIDTVSTPFAGYVTSQRRFPVEAHRLEGSAPCVLRGGPAGVAAAVRGYRP